MRTGGADEGGRREVRMGGGKCGWEERSDDLTTIPCIIAHTLHPCPYPASLSIPCILVHTLDHGSSTINPMTIGCLPSINFDEP